MKNIIPAAIFLSALPSQIQAADAKIYPGSMCRPISNSTHNVEYIQTYITNTSANTADINCPIVRDITTKAKPYAGSYIVIRNEQYTKTTCSIISQDIYGRKYISTKAAQGGPNTTTSVSSGSTSQYLALARRIQPSTDSRVTSATLANLYLEAANQARNRSPYLSVSERFIQLVESSGLNAGTNADISTVAEEFANLASNLTNSQLSEKSAAQRLAEQFLLIANGSKANPVSAYGLQKITFNTIPARAGDSYTITCKLPPFASALTYQVIEK